MKKSLWLKLLSKNVIDMQHEMGDTYQRIEKWSMKLHLFYFLLILVSIVMLIRIDNKVLSVVPLGMVVLLRSASMYDVKLQFKTFSQRRHFEFLYFFTLLVPHLSSARDSKTGLYRVLTKMEERLKEEGEGESDGVLKAGVNRLILEMTNNPGVLTPFIDFARTCSGTEIAEDVAVALFDFQQNSDDQQAITRLKNKVNRALEKRIGEIVDIKLRRFNWYSERVVMAVFVFLIGIIGTSIYVRVVDTFNLIKDLN